MEHLAIASCCPVVVGWEGEAGYLVGEVSLVGEVAHYERFPCQETVRSCLLGWILGREPSEHPYEARMTQYRCRNLLRIQ